MPFLLISESFCFVQSSSLQIANSTKTLPAVSASTGRRITPSPDRVTVCSPRSSHIINNSSKVLTADTVILMDTKDDPNGTEMHLNLESSDVPSSTTTHSNNLVVAHADQAPPSNSVPTCELGELVGEKWTPKETARR
ncbi:hypothetical protein FGIG_05171 [Fasciola gigantica]|uniref:Uncharacterized protein n=1 Tax=Fasciola gigantica TaxID=46835 RepID=A0A504YTJ4_FASGI|nr:hypothetical protein FGIG_05171 [Fasciola gigantica]